MNNDLLIILILYTKQMKACNTPRVYLLQELYEISEIFIGEVLLSSNDVSKITRVERLQTVKIFEVVE